MCTCKFRNKETGEEFSKTFYTEKEYTTFMIKCRYSKRIERMDKNKWV